MSKTSTFPSYLTVDHGFIVVLGFLLFCGLSVFVFVSLWGWVALKLSRPIFGCGAGFFFGLGCFSVCVGLG